MATATALTAESVVAAYRDYVAPHGTPAKMEIFVAGGGLRNGTLMGMLREGFAGMGAKVRAMEELGVPAQAKEGMAFALLAWLTWNRGGECSCGNGGEQGGGAGEGELAGMRMRCSILAAAMVITGCHGGTARERGDSGGGSGEQSE